MNAKAENAVFGEVHVLVAKQLLFGVGVDLHEKAANEVGQQHLHQKPLQSDFGLNDVIVLDFLVQRFEVFAEN